MDYELWDEHKFLGMMQAVKPRENYWLDLMFGYEITSENEYIDFEKIPAPGRVVAPYVMPLHAGRPVYEQASRAGRFKPAYSKLKDVIDPTMGLVKVAGSGEAITQPARLSIMQRRELIRATMNQQHVHAAQTLWELQAAQAVINGQYVVGGDDYPEQMINLGRAGNHTIIKGAGTRWGESGVSAWDDFQLVLDRMADAEFGGLPTRATMGRKVWAVLQKDVEFLKHMDVNMRGGAATLDRGLVGDDKSFKVGEVLVGGNSGKVIDLWVSVDKYQPKRGAAEVPFLAQNKIVFTGSKEAYQGYRCFGAIIDPKHGYAATPLAARNWEENGDPAVEYMLHQTAPLHVGLNPNATLSMEPVAA